MQYFKDLRTVEEVKREYHRLAMLHHPDRKGDTATMQDLNAQYAAALRRMSRHSTAESQRLRYWWRQEHPKS